MSDNTSQNTQKQIQTKQIQTKQTRMQKAEKRRDDKEQKKADGQKNSNLFRILDKYIKEIDMFSESLKVQKQNEDQNQNLKTQHLLDCEFSRDERSFLHEYVGKKGMTSQSVDVTGSIFKKMLISYSGSDEKKRVEPVLTLEDIQTFVEHTKAPFPCVCDDLKLVEYYNGVFDNLFDTKAKWDLFCEERKKFKTPFSTMFNTISNKMEKLVKGSENCERFQELRKSNFFTGFHDPSKLLRVKGDVYNLGSNGKKFLSIDIMTANFTSIKMIAPDVFGSGSWYEFIKKFTESEFAAKSKMFREIFFGRIGFTPSVGFIQETILQTVHERLVSYFESDPVLGKVFRTESIRMKNGDEMIYEVPDECAERLSEIIMDGSLLEKIKIIKKRDVPFLKALFEDFEAQHLKVPDTDEELGSNFHMRFFHVDQIESKRFFVKRFLASTDWLRSEKKVMFEFKNVEKKHYIQVLKRFTAQPILQEDLYFMDLGIKSQYCHSIFND